MLLITILLDIRCITSNRGDRSCMSVAISLFRRLHVKGNGWDWRAHWGDSNESSSADEKA